MQFRALHSHCPLDYLRARVVPRPILLLPNPLPKCIVSLSAAGNQIVSLPLLFRFSSQPQPAPPLVRLLPPRTSHFSPKPESTNLDLSAYSCAAAGRVASSTALAPPRNLPLAQPRTGSPILALFPEVSGSTFPFLHDLPGIAFVIPPGIEVLRVAVVSFAFCHYPRRRHPAAPFGVDSNTISPSGTHRCPLGDASSFPVHRAGPAGDLRAMHGIMDGHTPPRVVIRQPFPLDTRYRGVETSIWRTLERDFTQRKRPSGIAL